MKYIAGFLNENKTFYRRELSISHETSYRYSYHDTLYGGLELVKTPEVISTIRVLKEL